MSAKSSRLRALIRSLDLQFAAAAPGRCARRPCARLPSALSAAARGVPALAAALAAAFGLARRRVARRVWLWLGWARARARASVRRPARGRRSGPRRRPSSAARGWSRSCWSSTESEATWIGARVDLAVELDAERQVVGEAAEERDPAPLVGAQEVDLAGAQHGRDDATPPTTSAIARTLSAVAAARGLLARGRRLACGWPVARSAAASRDAASRTAGRGQPGLRGGRPDQRRRPRRRARHRPRSTRKATTVMLSRPPAVLACVDQLLRRARRGSPSGRGSRRSHRP